MHLLKYIKLLENRLTSTRPHHRPGMRFRKRSPRPKGDRLEAGQPALSEVCGEIPSELDRTLWDLFTTTASLYPEREALVSLWQPASRDQLSHPDIVRPPLQELPTPSGSGLALPSECLRWTYRDLHSKAEHLAHILESRHGCAPGMQLAVILWNCAEWGLFFWAAARLGMTFVPIDPRAVDDVPFMLGAVEPRVLVVQDAEAVASLTKSSGVASSSEGTVLQIHCSDHEDVPGWLSLRSILSPGCLVRGATVPRHKLISSSSRALSAPAAALIVFTSGTTARPKGCLHTSRNLVSQTTAYDPHASQHGSDGYEGSRNSDRWLVHTPVAHIFAINNALRAWRLGDTVIFPSRAFSVDSTAMALVRERCTIMSATPTLVKALMSHREVPRPDDLKEFLALVTIAGTMIGAEDIRLCREGLGSQDAIQAFGMSEGAPLISWSRQDPMLVEGYHPGVGKALPGTRIRICQPGTRIAVPRTRAGELHVGGTSVISGYLKDVEGDKFYDADGVRWLRTGDQAMMTEEGVVHILGRYKDLIIRGGENINPLAIEKVLNNSFPGIESQVVGVPDDMAGQIPVAVVKLLPEGVSKSHLIKQASVLGHHYTLGGVYTLEDLGVKEMPCTSLGKPKKVILADLVARHRFPNPERDMVVAAGKQELDLEEKLTQAWEQVAGFRPTKRESALYFADSITLLRYCDAVQQCCGRQIYLEDLWKTESVEKLASLLLSADRGVEPRLAKTIPGSIAARRSSVDSPSSVDHEKTGKDAPWGAAEARIASLGVRHAVIEDMIPVRYSLHRMVLGHRPQSYHVRVVFRLKSPSSYDQIRCGLSLALASRPLLRSMLVASKGEVCQAVIGVNDALLDRLIDTVEVETEDEARSIYEDSSAASHPCDFMIRAVVIKIQQTGHFMLALTYNHAIIDALSLVSWHKDLDRLISDRDAKIPNKTPYHLFANLFSQYEDSAPARRSTLFHAQRLRGISRCQRALWPPLRAPGSFISDDSGTQVASARNRLRNEVWNNEWEASESAFRFPRRSRVVQLPGLPNLQAVHGIEPCLFAVCALAIFNVLQTRSSIAVFNSWEGGRSWPFIPSWMQSSLPPATSIDGPTFQWILNMMEVRSGETVTDFLHRVSRERNHVLDHVHAPWEGVLAELREEAVVAEEASFRQSFVWDMSMGMAASQGFLNSFEKLQPVSRYDWPDCGFFWNAFMLDDRSLFFIASWDTAQMNVAQVDAHCDGFASVMRALAKEENWDKPMDEVFQI